MATVTTEPASHESQLLQGSSSGTVTTLLSLFEAAIQACINAGHIRPVPARLMAHFLFDAWNGVAALMLGPSGAILDPADAAQCLEQARNVALAGLAMTPALKNGNE